MRQYKNSQNANTLIAELRNIKLIFYNLFFIKSIF